MTEKQAAELAAIVPSAANTIAVIKTGNADDAPFDAFISRLMFAAPQLKIKEDDHLRPNRAGLRVGANLIWQAVPEDRTWPLLVDVLSGRQPFLPDEATRQLEELTLPGQLEVFINPGCPHCPQAVAQLLAFTRFPLVELTITDAALFPEYAAGKAIKAVPTTLLDGQWRWTGPPPLTEIAAALRDRSPLGLGPGALQAMLADGEAEKIAQIMITHNGIMPGLIALLTSETWSARLGPMVVMEYLAEAAPALAGAYTAPLWKAFEAVSDSVKGDLLSVLGEIGDRALREKLRPLLADDQPGEIREAAAEAIALIDNRADRRTTRA